MSTLALRIDQELRRRDECGVYEEELTQLWPLPDDDRESKIKDFADAHGFRLRYYREGLCAIFDRPPK
jgi:hypothetical protein